MKIDLHIHINADDGVFEDQAAADNYILLTINVDSLAAMLERFSNMAVDKSARTCHLHYRSAKDRDRVQDFIIKYQDRFLYGTDVGYYYGATGLHPNDVIIKYHDRMRSIHIKDKTGSKGNPPGQICHSKRRNTHFRHIAAAEEGEMANNCRYRA